MKHLAIPETPALPELVDDYLAFCAAKNLSRETLKTYRHGLDKFLMFANGPIVEIDSRTLRRFIFGMQTTLSPSSVRDYFGHLRGFFRYLEIEGIVSDNPAAGVALPRKGKKVPRVLTEAQAQQLLDACPDYEWTGLRNKTAIYLLLGSGIRLAELLAVDLGDINYDSGEIRIAGKGSRERIVNVDTDVIEVLRQWLVIRSKVLGGRIQEALFVNVKYGRMGRCFGIAVKRYAENAGFICTPHTCRHTYATNWIRNGGDIQRLKIQLGHSDLSMTEKYIHLARQDFQEAANQFSITRQLRFDSRQMQLL